MRRRDVAPGGLRGVSEWVGVGVGFVVGVRGRGKRGEAMAVFDSFLTVRGVAGVGEVLLVYGFVMGARAFFWAVG